MSARLLLIPDWEKLARQANFQPALMAALCPTSLRHLERFFAKQFNKTPKGWAREVKCRLARQLIEQGWSNKAVAAEFYFADESHFCHEFKRVYGVSPQTFAPLYGSASRREAAINFGPTLTFSPSNPRPAEVLDCEA